MSSIYALIVGALLFGGFESKAVPQTQTINRCLEYLSLAARPDTRVKILEVGSSVQHRPEMFDVTHVVLLMEQKTSHNYLLLMKTLTRTSLAEVRRRIVRLPPSELLLLELSADEHDVFVNDSIDYGSIGLSAPQQTSDTATGFGPIFQGTLLSIDGVPYVVAQAFKQSAYVSKQKTQHKTTFVVAALPSKPEKGVVGTKSHYLEVGVDGDLKLDGRTPTVVENLGQATALMTMLMNAWDGPQMRVEILEVRSDAEKLPNSRELVLKGFTRSPTVNVTDHLVNK